MSKKISLPNVTLIAATSVNVDQAQISLCISSQNIEFASVKLLSSYKPSFEIPNFEYISIPQMDINGYSRLMIKDLYKYFETNIGDIDLKLSSVNNISSAKFNSSIKLRKISMFSTSL